MPVFQRFTPAQFDSKFCVCIDLLQFEHSCPRTHSIYNANHSATCLRNRWFGQFLQVFFTDKARQAVEAFGSEDDPRALRPRMAQPHYDCLSSWYSGTDPVQILGSRLAITPTWDIPAILQLRSLEPQVSRATNVQLIMGINNTPTVTNDGPPLIRHLCALDPLKHLLDIKATVQRGRCVWFRLKKKCLT